jgi:hypothetical protein
MTHTQHGSPVNRSPAGLKRAATLALTTLALAMTTVYAGHDEHEGDNGHQPATCSKTTGLAFKACKNDIQDNYYLQIGKCLNESSDADRAACIEEAKATLKEERQLCGEQRQARADVCDLIGEAAYDPEINPADYVSPEQTAANPNPLFPLVPGTTRIYKAGDQTITVKVTDKTREILGVTTMEVSDIVTENGEPVEDTRDWYAQDVYGNVWYFGEVAQNFEDGVLTNLDGSWTAGVDQAKPGIVMEAAPQVGDVYRQEYLLGEAEDMGEVLDLYGSETAPAASCSGNCVVIRDFTPLEPDANEHKYYVPGIGNIVTVDVTTGDREELVQLIQP